MDYIRQSPEAASLNLENVYMFFKFKAYLQTTLYETKKAFCIKKWKAAEKITYMSPYDLCVLSDSKVKINTDNTMEEMKWAINQLEPSQIEVINLSLFSNLTDSEISSIKRVSRQSVNALKHRALKNLKNILENNV